MNDRPTKTGPAIARKLDDEADANELDALEAVAGEPVRDAIHLPPVYRYTNPIGQSTHVREGQVLDELDRRKADAAAKASKKA